MTDSASILLAFTSIFVVVDPVSNTITFLSLTRAMRPKDRARTARRGAAIGGVLLIVFSLAGQFILKFFGVHISYLRVAGGLLLLLVAIDMMLGRRSREGYTPEEQEEASHKEDISIFPLAIPMLAGPGAITTVMLLMQDAPSYAFRAMILGCIVVTFTLTWILFAGAERVQRVLGVTGSLVVLRVMGLFLAAVAVQYMAQGGWQIYRLVSSPSP